MPRHHLGQLFVYHLIITLLITGCGPRIGGGAMAAHLPDAPLVVDLPALYIDFDRSGIAYIGSVPAADLGAAFAIDLTQLNLDADQLQTIIDANIQHLQVTNTPKRLLFLINGRVLPAPTWTDESLATVGVTLQQMNAGLESIVRLLPVIVEIGGGVVLRFPVAKGMPPIPMTMVETNTTAMTTAQDRYLAVIGAPPQLAIDVCYWADGTWTVDDLDAAAWHQVLPIPWERLTLSPQDIEILRTGGISELAIITNREGIFVKVNNQPLPSITWANGELGNVIVLAQESGLFRQLLGDTPTAYSLAATLERLLPMVQVTEIELRVHFMGDSSP